MQQTVLLALCFAGRLSLCMFGFTFSSSIWWYLSMPIFLRCFMILLCCFLSLVKTNCTSFSFLCFRLRCLTICDCSIPQKYHGPLGRALSFVSLKWIKNYFTLFGEYLFHHFIQFFLLTTSHNLPLKKSKKKKTQKNQKNMHDHMGEASINTHNHMVTIQRLPSLQEYFLP